MAPIPSTIPFIRRHELHPILDREFSGCDRYLCILIAIENHQAISSFCGERTRNELIEQMFVRFEKRLKPNYKLFQISENKLVCAAPLDSETADDVIDIVDGCFSKPIVCENSPMIWLSRVGGVSVYPEDAKDGAALLSCAESALQYAHKRGGSRIQKFSHQIRERTNRFQLVYQRLCSAIELDSVELWFQPIYCPLSKKVTMCEALARWHDDVLGTVTPDEFILVAENSGLIKQLSEKLFLKLADYMVEVNAQLIQPVSFAFNVSRKELDMGIDHFISLALDKPLLAKHIILELTETAIANDDRCTQKTLSELREHGYQIAIDDFGTGYSALSCLDQFPFDYIKIDKHFIDRVFESVTDEIIIDATVAIARCMDVKVVAEGIENHAQALRLIEMGADYLQGYEVSQPQHKDNLREYLLCQQRLSR